MLRAPLRFWLAAISLCTLNVLSFPPGALAARGVPALHAAPAGARNPAQALASLSLTFERNEGQVNRAVLYLARGPGYTLFLTTQGAVLVLAGQPSASTFTVKGASSRAREDTDSILHAPSPGSWPKPAVIHFSPEGASRPAITGQDRQPGVVSYLVGRDASRWHTGIPTFDRVVYGNVYPGIDLAFYGRPGGGFEYDWLVHPGADPGRIRLRITGARSISIDRQGRLVIKTALGTLRQSIPAVYQPGSNVPVSGHFVLARAGTVALRLGRYDHQRPLVIDPAVNVKLFYSTYLGGTTSDEGLSTAVDRTGSAYVMGYTFSTDFPTCPGADPRCASSSGSTVEPAYPNCGCFPTAFVSKLNAAGTRLLYSTFLGGSGGEGLANYGGIAVDSSGNAYVTGSTSSTDFPICPSADPRCASSAGAPLQSSNYQDSLPCGTDRTGFVSKLNGSGTKLVYSTFLGGSCDAYLPSGGNTAADDPTSITVDSAGAAYVAGQTDAYDFPTCPGADSRCAAPGTALQTTKLNGTPTDAGKMFTGFVSKLDPTGSKLVYSTYLGGSTGPSPGSISQDQLSGIALDAAGDAYVAGFTAAIDYPTCPGADGRCATPGTALQPAHSSPGDNSVTVAELNPVGAKLIYSTYLGGSGEGEGLGIAVNGAGDAFVTGDTFATDFPVCPGADARCATPGSALQSTDFDTSDAPDAFVAKLATGGLKLVYSTYIGGTGGEEANAIALDSAGDAFVTGITGSLDFPTCPGADTRCATPGTALQSANLASETTAFVAELDPPGLKLIFSTYLGGTTGEQGNGIAIDAAGDAYVAGITGSADFPTCPGADPRCATPGTAMQTMNLATSFAGTAFVSKLGALDDTTLTPGAAWPSTEGAAHTQVIAHWSDPTDTSQGDATFTVLWGDGSPASSCSSAAANPTCFAAGSNLKLVNCDATSSSCDLQGTHTFAEESEPGNSPISIYVNDPDETPFNLFTSIAATVSDAALSAASVANTLSNGANPAGTCSQAVACSGIITGFKDASPYCGFEGETMDATGAPHYAISINWGDGSPTSTPTNVTQPAACTFAIAGSHSYATSGPKTISVTVTDEGCADNSPASSGGCSVVLTAGVMVAAVNDATITGAQQVNGVEGTAVTATIGSFSDADHTGSADWQVTVNWGDGSPPDYCTPAGPTACSFGTSATPPVGPAGTVQLYACDSATAPTHCLIQGRHTYAAEGSYQVSLSLADADQTSQPGIAISGAAISAGPDDTTLTPGAAWTSTEGASHTQVIAHWSDADSAPEPADATFSVLWGDGSLATCTMAGAAPSCFAAGSSLQLVNCNASKTACDVQGTHTFTEESEPGGNPIAIYVNDPDQTAFNVYTLLARTTGDAALTALGGNALTGPGFVPCAQLTACGGLVASFADTNSACTSEGEAVDGTTGAPHYLITISWGDGTASTSPSLVVPLGGCRYAIGGNHVYVAPGVYTVTVTVTDEACADGGTGCSVTIGGSTSAITNTVTVSTPASSSNLTGHTTVFAVAAAPGRYAFTFSAWYRAATTTMPAGFNGVLSYKDTGTPFFINGYGASGASIPPGIIAPLTVWCSSLGSPGCTLTIDAIQCSSTAATVYGHYVPANGVPYSFRIQVTGASITGPGSLQMTANSPNGVIVTPPLSAVAAILC